MPVLRVIAFLLLLAPGASVLADDHVEPLEYQAYKPGRAVLAGLKSGETYRIQVSAPAGAFLDGAKVGVVFRGTGPDRFHKTLHEGDPDLLYYYRPKVDGDASIAVMSYGVRPTGKTTLRWAKVEAGDAIEAEPNDAPADASALVIGRDVHGTADDVDYLENAEEGKTGLDWYRFEVTDERCLVYFQIDLLDRDVSCNLRCYTLDNAGRAIPYEVGKDPMEIVHDRERERYSKHISRVFTKGTYYLEVNANHPDYVLRGRKLGVPPYKDPASAIEAGMHYVINVGDAWFAQIPREGNIYARSANMHDTATRCTACHPSSFSTEANLVGHANGYSIRSKDAFQYVVERLYNSITPLYGPDGLYWQRFIAIPLQSQGKQGGIVADFERQVSGERRKTWERFAPFLRAAWAERTELPADEVNGVVPLDSKFGIGWRDWRVLTEAAARTGNGAYREAAANVARLLTEPAADKRVETLQDRMHRIVAWGLIDPKANTERLRAEAEALLALQNADGGWHEVDSKRGPSAVYTTGQLLWSLLRNGYTKDDPRIRRGLDYLLAQQQPFGGWIQTTTHENFRTPMRETRFAVMALAEAFPRRRDGRGWGNRDEGPARLPREGNVVELLDDLENLWDVPPADRRLFAREIVRHLEHPEPIVRARAAACLGRLEQREAVAGLVARLSDDSKVVWRAAAWALRRLGNAGIGVEELRTALDSDDPRTRRGAARVFAYQFQGMDDRLDIAGRLLELTADPDFWTRLQALKTLRQWFYRTDVASFQRRIVFAYLTRMSVPEHPVVRRNLSEGLYIMLDENLGGGVSLQKNIAQLPEPARKRVLDARADFERGVLLTPVLGALESGNHLQREAVVRAFDGSFFKGRYYARRPTGMIDVGNDREFGFLYEPPADVLDRTFAAVFARESRPEVRRQSLALAAFFGVPERTASAPVQRAILAALRDPEESVREAARKVASDSLVLTGAEADPERVKTVVELFAADGPTQAALVGALARTPGVSARPEVAAALRSMAADPAAAARLRPILGSALFTDSEALTVLSRAFTGTADPRERLALLDVLFARRSLVDVGEPSEQAVVLLKTAVNDPSAAVRERTLTGISGLAQLWRGKVSTGLLLSGLADDAPAVRRLALQLAPSKPMLWTRPDALDYLARLLIDTDLKTRELALTRVVESRLLERTPPLARRVKALSADPALKARAEAALRDQGHDPNDLTADITLGKPRLLSLASFRRTVNPLLYRSAEDGYSCARCHANHTILRVAEADPAAGFTPEQVATNYEAMLKVVNLGDPESSLVLRKPRSPLGQGGADAESPTGITHVGGPRWESTEDPAYRAILAWIREASASAASAGPEAVLSADSYSPSYEPAKAGDGDPATCWITEFVGASPAHPHELTLDLGSIRGVEGLLYVPRQDHENGRVRDYEIELSDDGRRWSRVSRGAWPNDAASKCVDLGGRTARFVKLRGLSEVNGGPWMSAAEVSVESTALP